MPCSANLSRTMVCRLKWLSSSVTRKNRQMSVKVAQKWFWRLHKNCLRLCEICVNDLLPMALKSCPKSNKLPNLFTLLSSQYLTIKEVTNLSEVQCCFSARYNDARSRTWQETSLSGLPCNSWIYDEHYSKFAQWKHHLQVGRYLRRSWNVNSLLVAYDFNGGAALTQWIRLCLPSCSHWLKSWAHLCFFILYSWNWH